MSTDNPYEPPEPEGPGSPKPSSDDISAGHAAYNVVSDTVTGLNVRKWDNVFQAIFIFVTVLLAAAVGAILMVMDGDPQSPWWGGALLGAFAGLILGLIGSGIFLMILRAVRHMQGKHK